jgi:hypothetical protein
MIRPEVILFKSRKEARRPAFAGPHMNDARSGLPVHTRHVRLQTRYISSGASCGDGHRQKRQKTRTTSMIAKTFFLA